eukprot:5859095-Alexandrium_andersonii.AAC.1
MHRSGAPQSSLSPQQQTQAAPKPRDSSSWRLLALLGSSARFFAALPDMSPQQQTEAAPKP